MGSTAQSTASDKARLFAPKIEIGRSSTWTAGLGELAGQALAVAALEIGEDHDPWSPAGLPQWIAPSDGQRERSTMGGNGLGRFVTVNRFTLSLPPAPRPQR
jgi:hypothetical protein